MPRIESEVDRTLRETRLYHALRRRLSTSPALYRFFARTLGNQRLIGPDTDLVLDGFPRSANSFVEAAFSVSQAGRGLVLASHSHAAAQIVDATRRGLPTVVLYREPDAAVASFMEMKPDGFDPRLLLREYATFYERILPVVERVALAPFSLSTRDFAAVVVRTNRQFGLDLAVPVVDKAFLEAVARERDALSRGRVGRATAYSAEHDEAALEDRCKRVARMRDRVAALANDPSRRRAGRAFEAMAAVDELREATAASLPGAEAARSAWTRLWCHFND